jgi:hypothetical protein
MPYQLSEYLFDGTRFQTQPFAQDPQHHPVFKLFFSQPNVQYLQSTIQRVGGFNAPPTTTELYSFMNEAYTFDMPNGAYNQLDPDRGRTDISYVKGYVNRLNEQIINRVVRNMSVMQNSQRQYAADISCFRGPLDHQQPINASCKTRGSHIRLDFLLP